MLSVNGVFGGIDINYEPPFVSAPKEGFGGSAEAFFESFQTLTRREDVVLKAREYGLLAPLSCSLPKANRSAGSTLR